MEPSGHGKEQWQLTMRSIMTLALTLGEDMRSLNPLLQGMVLAAFQSPLLRMVLINKKSYIAHTTAGINGISIDGMDNPLENSSSKGDLRARIFGNLGELSIDKNMGPRYRDSIDRELDRACSDAGNIMARTGDFTSPQAQRFSNLLPVTMASFGNAFEWKSVEIYRLSEFKEITLIEMDGELWYDIPTFALALSV